MKFLLAIFIFISSVPAATSCDKIERFDEQNSQIYVVCPGLDKLSEQEITKSIERIFTSGNLPADEYQIYFTTTRSVLSVRKFTEKTLIGSYYTHNNRLTIWPRVPEKKKIIIPEGR